MRLHLKAALPAVALILFVGCSGSGAAKSSGETGAASLSKLSETASFPVPAQFASAVRDSTRTLSGVPGPSYWQQEADYRLTARLFPDESRLEGDGIIVYRNNAPHRLFSLHLELTLNLHAPGAIRNDVVPVTSGVQLDAVSVNGVSLEDGGVSGGRFVVSGTQLVIVPPEPIPAGGDVEIGLSWSLEVPERGAGRRMGYIPGELFLMAYWYPVMSVFDDVTGWHTDTFRGDGEFYRGFGDYDVTIEAPAGWLISATGTHRNPDDVLQPQIVERLQRAKTSDATVSIVGPEDLNDVTVSNGDDVLRWHFTADDAIDFVWSATRRSLWDAGRAEVGDRDGDGETEYALVHALYRETAPQWAKAVEFGQHALTYFSELTGYPYPWPHMTSVEGSPIISGGMEYPMMTLISDYTGLDEGRFYGIIAHEFAHMWVPMLVATNERRHGWIDEGLTTFAENLAKSAWDPESQHRIPDLHEYVFTARRSIESRIMRWSDFHYPSGAYYTALYAKPATVLVALREVLGEAVFLEAYRSFISTWAYRHPYPQDLFATFERVSGRDLGWFWRSWYYGTEQLDQGIASVHERDGVVRVEVENIGAVPMPVILAVEFESGRVIERRFPAVERWMAGEERAVFSLPAEERVIRVEIDPEMLFPDVERSNNRWVPAD